LKAILINALEHPRINSVAIPGLGTGVGGLSPKLCANQMYTAYREIMLGEFTYPEGFIDAQKKQESLTGVSA